MVGRFVRVPGSWAKQLFAARHFWVVLGVALALLLPAAQSQTTFTGTGFSTASFGGPGDLSVSPVNISVSGVSGALSHLTLKFNGLTIDNPNNISFLLASPGSPGTAKALDFLSAACQGAISGYNLTFDDSGSQVSTGNGCSAITNNTTYKATVAAGITDSWGSFNSSQFQYAPPNGATLFSYFTALSGSSLNGTWKLYISNQTGTSTMVGLTSVQLIITASAGDNTSTSISRSSGSNPSFTSGAGSNVTFQATVTDTTNGATTVNGGTVAFTVDGSAATCQSGSSAAVSSGLFNCILVFTQGSHTVQASYGGVNGTFAASGTSNSIAQSANSHTTQNGNTYCNNGGISMPLTTQGPTIPYPSDIFVASGGDSTTAPTGGGIIDDITVSVNNLTYGPTGSGPDFLGFMLVGPNTKAFSMLDQAGSNTSVSNLSFTLSDTGTTLANDSTQLSNGGTYHPADFVQGTEVYGSGAPTSYDQAAPKGTATFIKEYGGAGATGTWQLFLNNGNPGQGNGTVGSWCITFMMSSGNPSTTTLTASVNGNTTQNALTTDSVVLKATVTSGATGTITFSDENGTLGTATLPTNTLTLSGATLTQGTHTITAQYNGDSNFGPSNGTLVFRVDAPTSTIVVGSTVNYCNSGAITIPYQGTFPNVAGPYPENVFVTALPGTTKTVNALLSGFTFNEPEHVESLLVGPVGNNGNNIDFFSNSGGTSDPMNIDLTFSDGGSTMPSNLTATGTYKPTSIGTDSFPACSPAAPTCGSLGPPAPTSGYHYAASQGSTTLNGQFGNQIANGTWSLYMQSNFATTGSVAGDSGAASGSPQKNPFCLAFTINPPSISATQGPNGLQVVQGSSSSVTVSITNNGAGSAGGALPVSVTDTFPSGLTPTGGSGTNWTCGAPSGQTITCTSSEFISSGNSFDTLTLNFSATNTATPGSVTNTAVVSGSGLTSSVNAPLSIQIVAAPDVTVTAGHTGTFTQGSTGTVTITGHNIITGSTTSGTTTVVDTLPSGWTLNASSSAGNVWTCGANMNVVTCTDHETIAGGSDYTQLTLTVNVPANSATSVQNSVTISGGGELSTYTGNDTSTDNLTVIQVPASITINGSQTQSATVGMAFGSLAVTVNDAAGVVISGAGVKFTAPAMGQSGTFSNSTNTITVSTNASGVADPGTFTANTKTGTYTVTAAPTTGSGSATFNLTNLAGTATLLTATSGTPQIVTVGMAAGVALVATAADQFGNPVSGVSVTFTAPGSGPSATFSNSTPTITGTTNSSGQITESFTANTAPGAYMITASAGGANSVNFSITNVAGTPTTVTATTGGGQTTNVNTQFTNALVATVTDTYGNPVSGVDVTFTPVPNANGATCTLASAGGMARTPVSGRNGRGNRTGTLKPHDGTSVDVMTGANGIAEATCTANGTAGAYSVTASTGTATSASFGLTNNSGTVMVTVATNIMGPTIAVDNGTPFTGSQTFQWTPDSQHTISTTSPQTNGTTQYVWLNWSDNGAISHMVNGPSTTTTFTANFKTQYQLTTNVNIAAGGTISPATGFYDAGSNINITATPNSPQYAFYNFTGDLGSSSSPLPITLRGPLSETANFTGGVTSLGMTLTGKSGPTNARVWTIAIGNNGPGYAVGAEIASLTFAVQSGGGAGCAPVVSGLPAVVPGAPIGVRATGTATVTIDFSSCPTNTFFKMTTVLSANNGTATATVVKGSQLP